MEAGVKLAIKVGTAVAVAAAAVAAVVTSQSAGAGPAVRTFQTHAANHNDTTDAANTGGACEQTPNGNVWAHDNLSIQLKVTDNGGGSYTVVETFTGSFDGFADPRAGEPTACEALDSAGSVSGTYTLTVQSPNGPSGAALLPNQDPATGLGAITAQLFPGNPVVTGGAYSFTYHKVAGADYTQAG
jgi:hypothetical protein